MGLTVGDQPDIQGVRTKLQLTRALVALIQNSKCGDARHG